MSKKKASISGDAARKTLKVWLLGILAYVLVLQSVAAASMMPKRFDAVRHDPFAVICVGTPGGTHADSVAGHAAPDTQKPVPECCGALCRLAGSGAFALLVPEAGEPEAVIYGLISHSGKKARFSLPRSNIRPPQARAPPHAAAV